jgi:hypothetical protein
LLSLFLHPHATHQQQVSNFNLPLHPKPYTTNNPYSLISNLCWFHPFQHANYTLIHSSSPTSVTSFHSCARIGMQFQNQWGIIRWGHNYPSLQFVQIPSIST